MDLNPLFTGITSFRPAEAGGELKLFEHAGIKLVHGWLVDPSAPEYQAVSRTQDYDTSVNLIVEADHLSQGLLVPDDAPPVKAEGSSQSQQQSALSPEDQEKVKDGKLAFQNLHSPAIDR